jgi:positive regulator of sigma E activity
VRKVSDGKASVWVKPSGACDNCSTRSMCDALSFRAEVIEVQNDAGATPGQMVELGVSPWAELSAALLLFVVPVVAFIAGVALSYALFESSDIPARQFIHFAAGTVALVLAWSLVRLVTPRLERSGIYTIRTTRVIK